MTVEPLRNGLTMDTHKLKIKIGEHEFEAEGPSEIVQAQFAVFRDLVSTLPTKTPELRAEPTPTPAADTNGASNGLRLDKIMKQEGRIVSLTARGGSIENEIVLVLLGQKRLRDNDSVTGSEIVDGLKLTGGAVGRIDYKLDKMTNDGDVITVGTRRARRYRLTNQGLTKAEALARTVISTVA